MKNISRLFLINSVFLLFPLLWFAYTQEELDGANFMGWNGYIVDYSSTPEKYRLSDSITRREMMKIIANMWSPALASCKWIFWDVKEWDWGCKYIEWARNFWIVAWNTNFRPNDNISKAEALKMLLNIKWIKKTSDTGNWQADYVQTAYDNKWYDSLWSDYTSAATRGWIFMSANRVINNIQVTWEVDDTQAVIDELFDFLNN